MFIWKWLIIIYLDNSDCFGFSWSLIFQENRLLPLVNNWQNHTSGFQWGSLMASGWCATEMSGATGLRCGLLGHLVGLPRFERKLAQRSWSRTWPHTQGDLLCPWQSLKQHLLCLPAALQLGCSSCIKPTGRVHLLMRRRGLLRVNTHTHTFSRVLLELFFSRCGGKCGYQPSFLLSLSALLRVSALLCSFLVLTLRGLERWL